MNRYRIEVYRLDFWTYSWRVYSTSATSRQPLCMGAAFTERGAFRRGERFVNTLDPVATREIE